MESAVRCDVDLTINTCVESKLQRKLYEINLQKHSLLRVQRPEYKSSSNTVPPL